MGNIAENSEAELQPQVQIQLTLIDERKRWEEEALLTPVPDDICLVEEEIAGVVCLWVKPPEIDVNKTVLYLHGGGLVAGSPVTHRSIAVSLAQVIGVTVLLVDYRLLPEHPFPAPLEDTLSVYHCLVSEKSLSGDQIILGGDSSGAALALSAMVQLRDSDSELPAGAFALSGAFDQTLSSESMRLNAERDTQLSYEELVEWRDQYLCGQERDATLSPLSANLSSLPPILLLAGGCELWLGDSLRLAEKIKRSGGRVQLKIWESMSHAWALNTKLKESVETVREIREFIHHL